MVIWFFAVKLGNITFIYSHNHNSSYMNIEQLLKEPEARKIFGKKEIDIILKQTHGIRLTQSEKNRLSKDIRKKFLFIEKAKNIKINLEHGSKIKNIIKRTVKEILKITKPEAILLFGSHATKNAWKRSDIDICIVLKKKLTIKKDTEIRIKILSRLPDKVDFWIFNNLPLHMQKSIANDHKVLMKSKAFDGNELVINVWKQDIDFQKMVKHEKETAA